MGTLNLEASLVKVLMAVVKAEQTLEYGRKLLAQHPSFEPYAAFQRINRFYKNGISSVELMNFLRDNDCYEFKEDCELLVNQYDVDKDGMMSYKEFLELVLPVTDTALRANVVQRENYLVKPDTTLPKGVEDGLCILIGTEMTHLKSIEKLRLNLVSRKDFDVVCLFNSIDCKGLNLIDFWGLEAYMKKRGAGAKHGDIPSIIRRLDKDMDCHISFKEFRDFLVGRQGTSLKEFMTPQKARTRRKKVQIPLTEYKSLAPVLDVTPTKPPTNSKYLSQASSPYLKEKIKIPPKKYPSFSLTPKILTLMEKEIEWGNITENIKQNLALRKDITISGLLALFNVPIGGYITPSQFISIANEVIKLKATNQEIYSIFSRFDRDSDDKLVKEDVMDMLMPLQLEYNDIIRQRIGNRELSEASILQIKQLMYEYIRIEKEGNDIKKSIEDRSGVMLISAFKELDRSDIGYLHKEEVISLG